MFSFNFQSTELLRFDVNQNLGLLMIHFRDERSHYDRPRTMKVRARLPTRMSLKADDLFTLEGNNGPVKLSVNKREVADGSFDDLDFAPIDCTYLRNYTAKLSMKVDLNDG